MRIKNKDMITVIRNGNIGAFTIVNFIPIVYEERIDIL